MAALKKTKLCRDFGSAQGCRYGDRCGFAHGEAELVTRDFTATPGGYPPSGYVPCGHSPLLFKWLHHSGYIIVVTS